ncbi:hypothetical protein JYK22_01920, partial [Nonomuraea sp. RK-328]|nr:hypothetical protein [Nonomuraea sp. RK-328]
MRIGELVRRTGTIATVLPCLAPGGLAPTCPDVIGRLRGERDRIDVAMANLQATRDALDIVLEKTRM